MEEKGAGEGAGEGEAGALVNPVPEVVNLQKKAKEKENIEEGANINEGGNEGGNIVKNSAVVNEPTVVNEPAVVNEPVVVNRPTGPNVGPNEAENVGAHVGANEAENEGANEGNVVTSNIENTNRIISTEELAPEDLAPAEISQAESQSVEKTSEELDLQPVKELMRKIETELSEMDSNYRNYLLELKAEREKDEREKAEREKIEKAERDRKAEALLKEKLERERIARETQNRLAEEKRRADEIRLAEEKDRRDKEEAARLVKEEAEKQQFIDLENRYKDKLEELKNMQISESNIAKINKQFPELKKQLLEADTLASLNAGTKLKIINGIIDLINANSPKTVGYIKTQSVYNEIFSDIMFIMTSYNNKEPDQQIEIDSLLKDDTENNNIFTTIKKLYNELKKNFSDFVNNIDNDTHPINNYNDIIGFMRKITAEHKSALQNKLSDLYEIIVGTARVAVRCKPMRIDNTTTKVPYESFRDYFNNLLGQNGGGTIVQKGGYNYADIFTVNNNRIKISTNCNDPTEDENIIKNGYGPFYSIYPPQYNNFHIYYNMFGLNQYNSSGSSNPDDATTIERYNGLLENNNLPKLKDGRIFDASTIKNKSHNLMKKLEKGGSVVIFGYGFSGSGKTYALIEGLNSPDHYDPSILEQFIKENAGSIQSVEFLELYPLGISHNPHTALTDTKKIISVTDNSSFTKDEEKAKVTIETLKDGEIQKYANECGIILKDNEITTNLYNNITTNISYKIISDRIRLLERHRFSKLRILATPNNDKSSRSFLQITIKLKEVTINNKQKTPKLVLFDMPGTENTIRIKTQFLGEDLFDKLNKSINTVAPEANFAIYNPKHVGNNVTYIASRYNKNREQFYSHTKNTNDTQKQLEIVFKNFIMQKTVFQAINVFIKDDETIAEDSLEFALFINGLDIERLAPNPNPNEKSNIKIMYNKIPQGKVIKFLTEELYIRIVNKFINFLIDKDDNSNNKYFTINTPNTNCKISSDLSTEDYANIKTIFNVKIDQTNTIGLGNLNTSFIHFYHKNMSSNQGEYIDDFDNDIYDLTGLFMTDIENEIKEVFKSIKIVGRNTERINLPELKNIEKIKNIKFYFANPLIKYIYLILNYLYKQSYTNSVQTLNSKLSKNPEISNALPQLFYRSATFFIYKYINFIVNQGRSIVTNLEHLKFFFLTRTGAIKKYNSDYPSQSFACSTEDCSDLIYSSTLNKKEYTKGTKVGESNITIQERINFGNMDVYGLIDILQKLSSSPLLKDCDTTGKTLNLLKSKNGIGKTVSTKDSLLGAIFIMFANYKIFLDNSAIDNEPIEIVKNKLDTLCKAAIDTAQFTQSISSTSVNQKLEAKPQAPQQGATSFENAFLSQTVGGKRKFNMNQLLEHKNKKPRTHRNLSSKNKKSRVFYNRTKKNI